MGQGIGIIGAGPVGTYAASLMAKKQNITVFEEHSAIGTPAHCTGIVTQEIFSFIPKNSKFVVNRIHDVRIIAPNGKAIGLNFKKPDIILDRVAFDNHFYNRALDSGAEVLLRHRFISLKNNKILVKDLAKNRSKSFAFSRLVGADGPNSIVGRSADMLGRRKFYIGVQAIVKKKNSNVLDFYPLHRGFGWSVPEDSSTLRIGVACEDNPRAEFERLLKRYGGKIIEKQGGLIPIYDPKASFCKNNIFLVGDAAGFVKATTGGGLVPGLRSAELLANSLIKGEDYPRQVRREIRPGLSLNLKLRRVMDDLSENEWNDLVQMFDNKRSKDVFQEMNRDRLMHLLFSTIVANPKMMKFGFRHLKALL
ncbi:MAG: NAD(P)/FAD-dependent oxidoreductase [archaeon]